MFARSLSDRRSRLDAVSESSNLYWWPSPQLGLEKDLGLCKGNLQVGVQVIGFPGRSVGARFFLKEAEICNISSFQDHNANRLTRLKDETHEVIHYSKEANIFLGNTNEVTQPCFEKV